MTANLMPDQPDWDEVISNIKATRTKQERSLAAEEEFAAWAKQTTTETEETDEGNLS